jgi:hypothetical protein
LGFVLDPSVFQTPSFIRLATSSMAALLGAQTRAFLGTTALLFVFPAWMDVTGPPLLDRNAPTSPHIVEVFPVPGGL